MTEEKQEEDAITVLTDKSVELFLKIRKGISDGLTKEQMSETEANQIALALTPKPIEMLSVIYTGYNETMDWDLEEPPIDEIPDDEILSGYRAEGGVQDDQTKEETNEDPSN